MARKITIIVNNFPVKSIWKYFKILYLYGMSKYTPKQRNKIYRAALKDFHDCGGFPICLLVKRVLKTNLACAFCVTKKDFPELFLFKRKGHAPYWFSDLNSDDRMVIRELVFLFSIEMTNTNITKKCPYCSFFKPCGNCDAKRKRHYVYINY